MDIVKEIRGLPGSMNGVDGTFVERKEVLAILECAGVLEGFPLERIVALITGLHAEIRYGLEDREVVINFNLKQHRIAEIAAIYALIAPVDPRREEWARKLYECAPNRETWTEIPKAWDELVEPESKAVWYQIAEAALELARVPA